MRIAIVNQPIDGILPPDQTSIGIWTYEVARRISAEHDVTVFGPVPGGLRSRRPKRVDDQGVAYRFSQVVPRRFWEAAERAWEKVIPRRRAIYASMSYYLEFIVPVALRLRRHQPEVIHIHNFTGFVPWIRLVCPKTPIVLHMNCEWLSQLDEAMMRRRISQVDEVFGSSNHITNLVRARFPEFADRCHTVYNGVDPSAFTVADPSARLHDSTDCEKLVFVGRVSPEKGVHDLIDAMKLVVEHHPAATLDLIGPVGAMPQSYIIDVSDDPDVTALSRFYDRPYLDHLTERAAPIADRVRFLGMMSHAAVVERVATAAILVNPSYSESFGMSLVEAMACGTPVVATRVGGMKEIVDDRTGVLVQPDDPERLAGAILELLDDPEGRAAMGTAGRDRVVRLFSWDRVAEAAVAGYARMVATGSREL